MTVTHSPLFDIGAVRELAGEASFARGEAYYHGGQVQILALGPRRVLAQVAGTEDYRTELTGCGKEIGGACSCPAFEDHGFCKHLVAVALAANEAGDAAAESGDRLACIRNYLKEQGADGLVVMIMDLAERDPALFRRLELAAAAVCADDAMLEARLRQAIDDATSTRGFVHYREAADWADRVDSVLDAVADLASGARAGLALKLVERAIDRIERGIDEIDDSDGHCGALLERAGEIHLNAARMARPDPVALARDLFVRETSGGYDTFTGAVSLYADVLGDVGLAEYRRLATSAWEKLPARVGEGRTHNHFSGGYDRLKRILDFFAERDGDVDARIALRAKDLSSPWSYLRLAEFCFSEGREAQALQYAEEGLWIFEDGRPEGRLVFFAVDLLLKASRTSDAQTHLQRAFEAAPSLEVYARLRELGGTPARDRAIGFMEGRLAKETCTQWHHPADLLVRILMRESMLDAAWAAVGRHGASMGAKEALARTSETTHPREALGVYEERVDQLANGGGNRA
ncbi:MAG TPA: SWIM zinc finger family protein [Acidisphaera sp.]|nr:SWIM zinc finger family protein [Acidisphaera sp.]